MSDPTKKPFGADDLMKKLGDARPGPALPGLGRSGAAQLPGFTPAGGSPLPGLGGGGGSALPGLGAKGAAVRPPFMQPPQQAPLDARNPFRAAGQTDPFSAHGQGLDYVVSEPEVAFAAQAAAAARMTGPKSKTPLYAAAAVIFLGCLIGFIAGLVIKGRTETNVAIRDARLIQFELKKPVALFGAVQNAISGALAKAGQNEFDATHLAFLGESVRGNPLNPTVLSDRNFKSFSAEAVQGLVDYNNQWTRLFLLIDEHRRLTANDEGLLSAPKAEFQRALTPAYGVVFARDEQKNNQLVANLVVLGKANGDKVETQAAPGAYGTKRKIYTSAADTDGEIGKAPEEWVVPVSEGAKSSLLQGKTASHFDKYALRLQGLADIVKVMEENQKNLVAKIDALAAESPAAFLCGGVHPASALEEYTEAAKAAAGEGPEAEGAPAKK